MLESDRLDFCCFLESGLRSFGEWSAGSFSEKKVDTRQIFQRHIIQVLVGGKGVPISAILVLDS